MRLLLADTDSAFAGALGSWLTTAGHVVDVVGSGTDAFWHAADGNHDALVLDMDLVDPDSLTICRTLRRRGVWAPVVLLSGKPTAEQGVGGLDAGADDYLPKPFEPDELDARLRALHRRGTHPRPTIMRSGGLEVDPARRMVSRGEHRIRLTAQEFELLSLLMRNKGMVVSRTQILNKVWDFASEPASNVIDATVRRLRLKVDRPFGARSIETVRGVGYRFADGTGRPADRQPG